MDLRLAKALDDLQAGAPRYAAVDFDRPCDQHLANPTATRGIPVTIWGAPDNLDRIKRYCDQRISRVVVSLPSARSAEILPTLDRWAEIIRKSAN